MEIAPITKVGKEERKDLSTVKIKPELIDLTFE
jgi:hypothetical protein